MHKNGRREIRIGTAASTGWNAGIESRQSLNLSRTGDVHMAMTGLDRWYGYIKSHDRAALWDLLHPDAVFESPVVHTPQRGRDISFKYLASADKVLGGPGFAYLREWRSDNGAVLEFETEIDGIKLNGVDIISFADDGRI